LRDLGLTSFSFSDCIGRVLHRFAIFNAAAFAAAYGLSQAEVEAVWRDFETDPMRRRVQPNLPCAHRRRLGLTESDRFNRAYRTRSQAW